MLHISTLLAGCAIETDNSGVAMAFIRMVKHIISPEAFVSLAVQLNPANIKAATQLALACVGVPS